VSEPKVFFKREISIDGVAVIVATLGLCAWLVTQKNKLDSVSDIQKEQGSMLKDHQKMIVDMEIRNETTDSLKKASDDHESRIRTLEKDADFLRVAGGH
jgi:hypothetical protein